MDNEGSQSIGYLTVKVYKAGMGLPVEGAQIQVRNEAGGEVERILITDRNGQTEKIELKAPPAANSLTPSNADSYSKYTIQTEKEGYFPVENTMVPIFADRTTLQQVALIPVPLGYNPSLQIIDDSEPKL